MLIDLLKRGAEKHHEIFGENLRCLIKWRVDEYDDECNVYIKLLYLNTGYNLPFSNDGFSINNNDSSSILFSSDCISMGVDCYNSWHNVGTSINFMSNYIDKIVRTMFAFNKNNFGAVHGLASLLKYVPIEGDGNLFLNNETNVLCRLCKCCNKYEESSKFIDSIHVCGSCFKNSVVCPNCKSVHSKVNFKSVKVDGLEYCCDCILDDMEKGVARETRYSRKVDPIFMGEGIFHFGVEFEVEVHKDENYNVQDVMDIVHKFNKHVYFKGDTSIEHGIEIITHPCSYDYHKSYTSPMVEMLNDIGAYGDNTGTCGLHIHIGRDRIHGDKEIAIGRIMYIFNKHWDKIVKFARRDLRRLERWGKKPMSGDMSDSDIPKQNFFFAKQRNKILDIFFKSCYNNNRDLDRYRAVNLNCVNTIEFRVFDGTTNNRYFLASLQFIHMVMDLANSNFDIIDLSFEDLFCTHHKIFNEVYDELVRV